MKQSLFYLLSLFTILTIGPIDAACTPAGTAGDDTVACTGTISSFQYFYGGSDRVTLTGVTARSYNNSYWLDEALGGNPITDGNDTFVAHNSQFYWVFGFGGDDTFRIDHSEFNNAYGDTNPMRGFGNRGNDTFTIKNSTSYGYILGGNDNDTITIIDSNVSNVASGYSDIYPDADYTPYDGNDTILLDHVNFTSPLYWDTTQVEGMVGGGRGDDWITFKNGGEAYYVYGGHGNDIIEVFDDETFHACSASPQIADRCGIYGDESYASELNASAAAILHGDDHILLHSGNANGILIQGGDGSDIVTIETPVLLKDTELNGGDDVSSADTFVDRIEFKQWIGDLNGSQFHNWEQIQLLNASSITFADGNITAGLDGGTAGTSGRPYGLIVDDGSQLNLYHDFLIDANLQNNAIVNLQDGNASGTELNVAGNYGAVLGALYLDTVLNDATSSISDTLVIEGNSSGTTLLNIDNIGGAGGQTPTGDNSGILIVEVRGDSNGIFRLADPLQTTDYWYHLLKGSNGNWYLQSEKKLASLSLVKTVDASTIDTPGTLHYQVELSNTGNIPLTHIHVTDTLPDGSAGTLLYLSGDENGNGILDVGERWAYRVDYSVSAEQIENGGVLVNTVTVDTDQTSQKEANVQTAILCWCAPIPSDSAGALLLFWSIPIWLLAGIFLRRRTAVGL